MEYIDRIFYRKINPSDFKKLYDIDRPQSGGGQTYLEAAGIPNSEIVDFLEYAEITDSPLNNETRSIYTFNARVLGDSSKHDFIEFAPRGGRNNYRISRQNMRYKHPAWSEDNGFPQPNRDADGNFTSDGNFDGIIDNLVIIILRTTYRKYYAGYINSAEMPLEWPSNIGLEVMFEGDRRGVIHLPAEGVEFEDSLYCPFGYSNLPTENNGAIDTDEVIAKGGINKIFYGAPGCGKSRYVSDMLHYADVSEENIVRVTFHPEYTNVDFIGQIMPTIEQDEDGNEVVKYIFNPGAFTLALEKAYNTADMVYLIVEEINRGNAAAIFGDMFQLLDRVRDTDNPDYSASEYPICNPNMQKYLIDYAKKARIQTRLEKGVFIPSNLTILATMNSSDQNVFTLDTAFKRRWHFEQISNNITRDTQHAYKNWFIPGTDVTWEVFLTSLNNKILEYKIHSQTNEDKRLGKYFVTKECLTEEVESITDVQDVAMEFAYKVLEYVWNDVCKIGREEWFDTEKYKTLEELIDAFVNPYGEDTPLSIFQNINF